MNLKDIIAAKTVEMTASQLKITSYILNNPEEAAFYTAGQMAVAAHTSEASVVRYAAFLGFERYQEFRLALSHLLIDRLSTLERFKESHVEQKENLYVSMLQRDKDAISAAQDSQLIDEIERMGEDFARRGSIYIAAYRSSYALAYYLSFYLSWILPDVRLLNPENAHEILYNSKENSILLGISFPRYSQWTVDILKFAREKGMPLAAITNDITSPLAAGADYLLTVPYRTVSFIDSFAAPMSVINCLILSVYRHKSVDASKLLAELEDKWESLGMYVRDKM